MNKAFLRNVEAKNAIWIIGGKITQMILSLFVGTLSARYLGPANYGTINYATALTSFFMSFCTLGLHAVIVKDFVENPKDQGSALGTAIAMRFVSSLCSCVLIVCVSLVVDYGDWELIAVVILCCVSLLFHVLDTIGYWFQAQHKSKVNAIAGVIAYVITSCYKIILLVCKADVWWFALAFSVDYAVLGGFQLICYKKSGGPPMRVSLEKGRSLLTKSYHYILSGMMVAIYGHTDKLMLKQMLGEDAVGYYSTATTICSMWTFVLSAVIDSMYPTIISSFKESKEDFERRNRQLYAVVFYITVFVSLLFVFMGDFIIRLLYGSAYAPAGAPLKVVTWYTAFSYFGVARGAWMVCNEKQKYLKYMYIFAAFANIGLNLALIPLMGAVGAALASLVTQIFTSIVLPSFIKDLRPNAKLIVEAILLKGVFKKEDR